MQKHPPCVLTIAGSDSGGGAGIQADIKTITVLGGYAMSAITALTAQNGLGVTGIHAPEASFVALQIKTVREGFPVAAAKTGMLFDSNIIDAVAKQVAARTFPLVVDPVCVSQSGHRLLREDAVNALKWRILPEADVFTPNAPEATLLTGIDIHTREDIARACEMLLNWGAAAVLLKGGHLGASTEPTTTGLHTPHEAGEAYFVDWLALPGQAVLPLPQPAVDTPNNHGTGCTLSAAIATFLAHGLPLQEAIVAAQTYLNQALSASYAPGLGAGPPNHAVNVHACSKAR